MADQLKKISEWEKIQGRVLLNADDIDFDKKVTVDEFNVISDEHTYIGVDWEFRVPWLKRNGYEVTRENLVDAELPTVKPVE